MCVFERELEVCGRKWGKIITANWPEAFFPPPVTTARTHERHLQKSFVNTNVVVCVF